MEVFVLAAVSLAIAVSLMLKKETDRPQRAFAALCVALFVWKASEFLRGALGGAAWTVLYRAGLLGAAPLLLHFVRQMLQGNTPLGRQGVLLVGGASGLIFLSFFTPLRDWIPLEGLSAACLGLTLVWGLAAMLRFLRGSAPFVERKRVRYTLLASAFVLAVGLLEWLLTGRGAFPTLANLLLAGLLYVILTVIVHRRMPEFYEITARAAILLAITAFATAVFFLILGLFGSGSSIRFTLVFLSAFIVIISYDPLRMLLKKVFGYLYPEGRDLFLSLYGFEAEVEKEKTLFLDEMATALAHEVRTPLGSIKGAGQFLRSDTENAEHRQMIDVIVEEADRLNSVVSQFLNYARPYALETRRENVNHVVRRAVSILQANALSERVVIETDLCPDIPAVQVDPEQLLQVILNIALNGIEAMPGGGTLILRTTHIEAEEGEAVGIAIRDTGGGISAADLNNIFKPFFTTKKRGIGLGLAICQRIIREHRGRIRVKSIPGKGSIFYIRLEAAP